ncbi:MAG TPA: G8 domain-containing protein, partial [Vicinamibacterales bacterium]
MSAIPILAGRADAQFANGIPNLCTNPTVQSVRNGSWSDAGTWSGGHLPTVNDRVAIAPGHTVTYDRNSSEDIWCVNVFGQLTFRTDITTRLTVGTLSILPGGGLQIGTSGSPVSAQAEIVISDRPIDTGSDPEQYGTGLIGFGRITMHGAVKSPTFVRLAGEAGVGQSSLGLAAGVSGWQPGDRLVLPGSQQTSDAGSYEGFWETPTVSSASGAQVALTSGLAYAHRGGRNAAGALVFLPHV